MAPTTLIRFSSLPLELFSKPVISITPKDVFEDQHFNLSCRSFNISEKHMASRNVKYTLYKDNKRLIDGYFTALASKANSGIYYCEAFAKGITKVSMPLVVNVKGKQTIELSGDLVIVNVHVVGSKNRILFHSNIITLNCTCLYQSEMT